MSTPSIGPRKGIVGPGAARRDAVSRLSAVLLAVASGAMPAFAQEDARGAGGGAASVAAGSPPDFAASGDALAEAIDPDTYVLGPLDGVVLAIWDPAGGHAASHALSVTFDERLLIPSAGDVDVGGLTLSEAEREIGRLVRARIGDVRVTLTLTRLRRMKIPVTGRVLAPGIHVARSLDRVSELLTRVGLAGDASHRRIEVRRGDTLRARADLVRFRALGDLSENPFLENGDIVHVPFARDHVHVHGAVADEGRHERVEGDRVTDILAHAGGFTADALTDTIELARVDAPDRPPRRVRLVAVPGADGKTIYVPAEGPRGDYLLERNDRLFVKRLGDDENRQIASVSGEVHNPGALPIVEGTTRLSEVIARAGGVRPEGSLAEATLVRTASAGLTDPEYERLRKIPVADMTEDEYEYVKMRERARPGRMVVDFERLLLEGDRSQDVTLVDGDEIRVPRAKDHVSVLGIVANPGDVTFEPDLGYDDYIRLAGGFAERADRGKARVVRIGGGEWAEPGEVDTFRPGDTIWVPERRDRDWWRFFRDSLLVATQIATLYLVADQATR